MFSAWWVSPSQTENLTRFIRRSIRVGCYTADPYYDFEELRNEAYRRLFISLSLNYWDNRCHPLPHKAILLENGRILDRFYTRG